MRPARPKCSSLPVYSQRNTPPFKHDERHGCQQVSESAQISHQQSFFKKLFEGDGGMLS